MNSLQLKIKKSFLAKLKSSEYKTIPNPCLCGNKKGHIVAGHDRYGITLITKFCLNCGLVRSDPYYTQKTLNQFYQQEYRPLYTGKQTISSQFLEDSIQEGKNIYNFLREHYYKTEINNKTVFEIGCGSGGILKYFADQVNRVAGCDLGDDYLKIGQKHGLRLVQGQPNSLVKYGLADIVILNHVLEHFTDPEVQINQISKLLKPDGILYIALPGIFDIHRTYGSFNAFLQNAHVFHFTLQTLNNLLISTKFTPIFGNQTIRAIYKTKISKTYIFPPWIYTYFKTIGLHKKIYLFKRKVEETTVNALKKYPPLYKLIKSLTIVKNA